MRYNSSTKIGNEREMASENIIRYRTPRQWAAYDPAAIMDLLVAAKTAAGVLHSLPYLNQWIAQIHEEQLRLEAAGTSRIEGAEFTQREQEEALAPAAATRTDLTRSQRQLRAADGAYRWLRSLPADRPVTADFILDVHRRIVTGCDDDHCEPGALRPTGWNVTFGTPRCRGAEGGDDCRAAFNGLCDAVNGELRRHDGIIRALAVHYHIGAMHPFGDGNGRTTRAVESFMLRSAGVSGLVMVSLSNYYYAHKDEYLAALATSRQAGHDLTPFLRFALPAITERCNATAAIIIDHHRRELFRQFSRSLFGQLRNKRRRVLAERQLHILDTLLDAASTNLGNLSTTMVGTHYANLKYPDRALVRDMIGLIDLGAIRMNNALAVEVNLDWPQQFSESELLERYEQMPAAVSANHPAMAALAHLLGRRR